jgi:hypothetical protein
VPLLLHALVGPAASHATKRAPRALAIRRVFGVIPRIDEHAVGMPPRVRFFVLPVLLRHRRPLFRSDLRCERHGSRRRERVARPGTRANDRSEHVSSRHRGRGYAVNTSRDLTERARQFESLKPLDRHTLAATIHEGRGRLDLTRQGLGNSEGM